MKVGEEQVRSEEDGTAVRIRKDSERIFRVRIGDVPYIVAGEKTALTLYERGSDSRLLSHSQISDFGRCRYRWHLHKERGIVSRKDKRPLAMGSIGHRLMAAGIKYHTGHFADFALQMGLRDVFHSIAEEWGEEWLQGLGREPTEEEKDELHEMKQEAVDIALRAVRNIDFGRYDTIILDDGTPLIEANLVVPFKRSPNWDGFRFYCDWVCRDLENGLNWLVDHKWRKQFTDSSAEQVNQQMLTYSFALGYFGVKVDGTALYQVRRRTPEIPDENKTGGMSRRRIATDWETYRKAVVDHGYDPEDYLDMKSKLDYEFQRWTRAHHSPTKLARVWHHSLVPAAQNMGRKRKKIYRALHQMECTGCWAREFCLAELRDEDTDHLLQTKFRDKNAEPVARARGPTKITMTDDTENDDG